MESPAAVQTMAEFLSLWERSIVTENIGIDDEEQVFAGLSLLTHYETLVLPIPVVCLKRFGFFCAHPYLGTPDVIRPTKMALVETVAPASLVEQIAVFVCANFPAYILATDKTSDLDQVMVRVYCSELLPANLLPPVPHEAILKEKFNLKIHSFQPSHHECVYMSRIIYSRFHGAIFNLGAQAKKMLAMLAVRSSTIRHSPPLMETDKDILNQLAMEVVKNKEKH
jgi:hypothetical protein